MAYIPTDKNHVLLRFNLTSRSVREWWRDKRKSRFVYCEMLPRVKKVACIDDFSGDDVKGSLKIYVFDAFRLADPVSVLTIETGTREVFMSLYVVETSEGIAIRTFLILIFTNI